MQEIPDSRSGTRDHGGFFNISELRGRRVHIRTFGCTYNHADTRKLMEVLKFQGCTIAVNPSEADAVVINTCTVIATTERKVLRELGRFRSSDLYVTGCMPLVQMEAVLSVCEPRVIHPRDIEHAYRKIRTSPRGAVGIVQVGTGCVGNCSYCLTRMARGPLQSFMSGEICARVRGLAEHDAVEIRLTGQDLSAWGRDLGSDLSSLLEDISGLPGNFRVRVGMMNPATLLPVLDKVVKSFRSPRIFSFLHLPVQSGSDDVLKRMRRGYEAGDVIRIVRAFQKTLPWITLATDVICGFPGETEEDFSQTLDLLSRIRPVKVNITRYSPRPGTRAAEELDMPDRFKKERSRRLLVHAESIAGSINREWIGQVVPVVITERIRPGTSMGRTPWYQGVVVKGDHSPGREGDVRLLEDRTYFFYGEFTGK